MEVVTDNRVANGYKSRVQCGMFVVGTLATTCILLTVSILTLVCLARGDWLMSGKAECTEIDTVDVCQHRTDGRRCYACLAKYSDTITDTALILPILLLFVECCMVIYALFYCMCCDCCTKCLGLNIEQSLL